MPPGTGDNELSRADDRPETEVADDESMPDDDEKGR